MPSKKLFVLTSLIVVVGILVTACQPERVVETVVVTEVVAGERLRSSSPPRRRRKSPRRPRLGASYQPRD